MIAVFKTNVGYKIDYELVLQELNKKYLGRKITVDLEDCDKILRVEGDVFIPNDIQMIVINMGYQCEELPIIWSL